MVAVESMHNYSERKRIGYKTGRFENVLEVKRLFVAPFMIGALLAAQSAAQDATEERQRKPIVLSGNENVEVRLSGRVHRMLQFVADGRENDVFFTDSAQGPTILRVDVAGKASDTLTVGGALEIGLQQNNPIFVSQDTPDAGFDVSGRVAEIFLESKRLGRFGLGRGFASAWVAPEVDLSGTQFASLLPVGNLFPGLKFVDSQTKKITDIQILNHFADLERFLIADRFRYDSPRFAGVRLSGSVAADARWDVALRSRHSVGDFTLAGASTYQNEPLQDVDWRWDVAISVRHEPSGLNATVGGLRQRVGGARNSDGFVVKGGWLARLFAIGRTAISADFTQNNDVVAGGDQARSVGLFVLQNWSRFGVHFYIGVRRYSVEQPEMSLEPITVLPIGALISF